MIKQYQITLMCKSRKYKPVSCIIKHEEVDLNRDKIGKKAIQLEGIKKICGQRLWSSKDLGRYEYTIAKVREYDRERIQEEAAARYEAIKEAKYATGEWKRPTKKE